MNKETKIRVLIVDDDRVCRKLLAKLMIQLSYEIADRPLNELSICPVDLPPVLELRKEPKDNHWRNGSTKKGGKVGYERR